MPIKSYSLLKCKPLQYGIGGGHAPGAKPKQSDHPHFQVLVEGKRGQLHRIAVNIVSDGAPSGTKSSMIRLFYAKTFSLPALTSQLLATSIGFGFKALPSHPNGIALDFVRTTGLVDTAKMKLMPFEETGPDNDIQDILQELFDAAINEGQIVFAFGAAWTDNKQVFFDGEDGGIHDIHCNQGNPAKGGHSKDNGTFQDGAILFYHPSKKTWKAVFMAFDSQFTGNKIVSDEKGNQSGGKTEKLPQKKRPKRHTKKLK